MSSFTYLQRRQLLQYGAGFLGTSLAASVLGPLALTPPGAAADNRPVTPEEALQKLVAGNERFSQQQGRNPRQDQYRLQTVAAGQAPFAAILGCADSRLPPEIVFDQGLGDLFVCRIAGNIATAEEVASMEFGALVLGAKALMVMGHQACGAVQAALAGGELPGQIGVLMKSIRTGEPTAPKDSAEALEQATKANVLRQVEVLKKSSVLQDLVDQKQLVIVGAFYSLDTGRVTLLS